MSNAYHICQPPDLPVVRRKEKADCVSFFKRLLGHRSKPPALEGPRSDSAASIAAPESDATKPQETIRVFDDYGREFLVTRQVWIEQVLPESIKQAWSDPEKLYGLIALALNEGLRLEILAAAEHLYSTDPVHTRAACVWGVLLEEVGRLKEAEKVFTKYLRTNGNEGVILTNLAKVYSRQGKQAKAQETLLRALTADPNQENGLMWYALSHKERAGNAGWLEALRCIAAFPASWRAQLWLARESLERETLPEAISWYQDGLARAGTPAPSDLLQQMSGDLGNHNQLVALIRLTEHRYDPAIHGLGAGNNLIKAHVELGELDAAQKHLDALYRQQRPDWTATLHYWEEEIGNRRRSGLPPLKADSFEVKMVTFDGPIWLAQHSPAAAILPLICADADTPWICFFGSSVESDSEPTGPMLQSSDASGRMSRGIPLFLCEQTEMGMCAKGRVLMPLLTKPTPAFMKTRRPYEVDESSQFARDGNPPADYLVMTHLVADVQNWRLQTKLIRTIDGSVLRDWDDPLDVASPESALTSLAVNLCGGPHQHAGCSMRPRPAAYQVPDGQLFAEYLLRLEQLLAVRCTNAEQALRELLYGAREILQGNIQLCLGAPQNATVRVLLLQTMLSMKNLQAGIVNEFSEKVRRLQREFPLHESVHGPVQRLAERVLDQ